jgi:hypothetical protein
MADDDKKQRLEEWIAQEQARLKKGFEYTPKPTTSSSGPDVAGEVLTGLGVGAGVVGGAVGPHTNPVTFEGVRTSTIAEALRSEFTADDSRVEVERSGDSTIVTILLNQADTYQFLPALTVTLLESAGQLTVTMGDLDRDVVRGALASIGGAVVDQGKDLLFRRRGIAGVLDAAGNLIDGLSDVAENIDDMTLPRQVWEVIDRVGNAAEEAYREKKRQQEERQRQRQEAERAWTHCPSCGRAFRPDENERVDCPSCGGVRGGKPDWL